MWLGATAGWTCCALQNPKAAPFAASSVCSAQHTDEYTAALIQGLLSKDTNLKAPLPSPPSPPTPATGRGLSQSKALAYQPSGFRSPGCCPASRAQITSVKPPPLRG